MPAQTLGGQHVVAAASREHDLSYAGPNQRMAESFWLIVEGARPLSCSSNNHSSITNLLNSRPSH